MNSAARRKKLFLSLALLAGFALVLIVIFLPLFGGHNGLNYLDSLYNSISKASAYYIPKVKEESGQFLGQAVELSLTLADQAEAERAALLLKAAGAETAVSGSQVMARGGLGEALKSCLDDADDMFHNRGQKIADRYGLEERLALYTWWNVLKAMQKDLNRQKKFPQAKMVETVQTKAVECAYNYYRIEPQKIGDRWVVVAFSLLFYVIYTVWYGYGVMFFLEGTGFRLEH